MLPEVLSADACSLVENADRAVLACHLTIAPDGMLLAHRFTRATIRCVANIAYEEAQATHDAGAGTWAEVLKPLWGAWGALAKARAARAPLDLDLPERRVELDETGKIVAIVLREQLDAHRLIEDFMIAANVAAALALEAKKTVCMYRVHETPGREKLVALKDYLETFGLSFALGQVMQPRTFNGILTAVKGTESAQQISEQVLRTQTQAYYSPENKGHFGLALGSYGHFTSPIRRYADLIVHRALVRALGLGDDGLTDRDMAQMKDTAELITHAERRAMAAERDATDRYVASFLSDRVGAEFDGRITGVTRFGLFIRLSETGADGLVPVSNLGGEFFVHDDRMHALVGERTGARWPLGMPVQVRLREATPITGGLLFEMLSDPTPPDPTAPRPRLGVRRRGDAPRHGGPPKSTRGPKSAKRKPGAGKRR
jgi:ribonuclease R